MNRTSEFRRVENMHKPITPQEKFNDTDDQQLSLLREFWRNNYAQVIFTGEADNIPTDEKKLLDDYGIVGWHSSGSNDLSVHAKKLVPLDMFAFSGNQMMTEKDMLQSLRSSLAKKKQTCNHRIA